MRIVTRARELDSARLGEELPSKSGTRRRWLEPPARILGLAIAGFAAMAPAKAALAWHDFLYRRLAAPRSIPFDATQPELARAAALARYAESATGKAPALIALLSHPPVDGELGFLNLELARHATLALRVVRGRACRPRLLVAVDPFALDSLSLFQEGVYAAYMSAAHLGFDRQALGRPALSRWLPPGTSWPRLPWRLLRAVSVGGEVALALGGGVPGTARVLYAAREWARDMRRLSPLDSGPWRRRLEDSVLFQRFISEADPVLPRPRHPALLLEAWLMCSAAGFSGASAEDAAAAAMEVLGIPLSKRPGRLLDLRRALSRETPYRLRFFRFLARRAATGRPILFLPIVHRAAPLGVEPRPAWAWLGADGDFVRVARSGAPEEIRTESADSFAEHLVEESFA